MPRTKTSAAWFALLVGACGGGGGASDSETVERTTMQKECDSLMSVWCESSTECVQSGLPPEEMLTEDELAEARELCLEVAKRTCDGVTSANAGYEECHASVETLSEADCEAVREAVAQNAAGEDVKVPMPESCVGLYNGSF